MFKFVIEADVLAHAKDQVSRVNFGRRSFGNGTPEQQLNGIAAQCAMQRAFGLPLLRAGNECDDGVDFQYAGLTLDVKTMGRTTDVRPSYVNNLVAVQISLATDVLVFCSLHKLKQELTVCGWLPKHLFIQRAAFFPKGSTRARSDGTTFQTFADLYEIPNSRLNDVDSLEDLKTQLERFAAERKAMAADPKPQPARSNRDELVALARRGAEDRVEGDGPIDGWHAAMTTSQFILAEMKRAALEARAALDAHVPVGWPARTRT